MVDNPAGTVARTAAFLAIWHDIAVGDGHAFELWHTREHMPERLSLPGFVRGRRGRSLRGGRQPWITLYEGSSLDAFASAAYRERLDRPTPWTTRLQPSFLDFARVACETITEAGTGVGGATASFRLRLAGPVRSLATSAPATAAALVQLDAVSRVVVGLARPDVSSGPTRERELRGGADDSDFDAVVLVDGVDEAALAACVPHVRDTLAATEGVAVEAEGVYALSYLLTAADLADPVADGGARPRA